VNECGLRASSSLGGRPTSIAASDASVMAGMVNDEMAGMPLAELPIQ
jgi:hypothetical protein